MVDRIELTIEKAVAGGRMLARHEGQVVLVSGAIPGERVRVRIERRTKQLLFAAVTDVLEPSAHRREPFCDARCGGVAYVHIDPVHQRTLKAGIIADAFRRIGGVTIPDVTVAASPEEGYRLRARLHVSGTRAGFFIEGSHSLCDAVGTRQMRAEVLPAVTSVIAQLGAAAAACEAVTVAENVDASERVCHLELKDGAKVSQLPRNWELSPAVTGVTAQSGQRLAALAGEPRITERAGTLFRGASPIDPSVQWSRLAPAFFQGNRFLVGDLVNAVLARVDGDRVADLYAGVGLFALTMAASGKQVVAVEHDDICGEDLDTNVASFDGVVAVRRESVEAALPSIGRGHVDTIVLDPPRTGVSTHALQGLIAIEARRLVYVSCDPATLARDARALAAAGYRLESMAGFDLFPNTPHVEAVAIFDRA